MNKTTNFELQYLLNHISKIKDIRLDRLLSHVDVL
jgi:hypothetical protein